MVCKRFGAAFSRMISCAAAASIMSMDLAAQAPDPPARPAGSPSGAPANSKLADRERQVKIASDRFGESVRQVSLAHSMFSETARASVIYEELNAQSRSGSCKKELAKAKTDSSRARTDLGKAVRAAKSRFDQAVSTAARIDADFFKNGVGRSSAEEFPWYPKDERDRIRERLQTLQDMFRFVDSSMTSDDRRADLWKTAGDYEALGPAHGFPVGDADALVPATITVPCVGKTVPMHVSPPKR